MRLEVGLAGFHLTRSLLDVLSAGYPAVDLKPSSALAAVEMRVVLAACYHHQRNTCFLVSCDHVTRHFEHSVPLLSQMWL